MRKILLLVVFFLLLSSSVLADSACLNDTYTQFSTNLIVSGNSIPVSYEEYCPFNCTNTTGECNPNPYDSSGIEFFILLAIAAILLFTGKVLNEEDWAIQLLFLIASLVLIVASLGLLVTRESQTGNILFSGTMTYVYYFAMAILMIIIFYYMIKTILKVLFSVAKK